jgi:aminopeptidase N
VAGADGIGDPYFPLDGNGGYDVLRYAIDVGYGFGTGRLSGQTTLTLVPKQELTTFNLDFLLPVSRVTIDGAVAVFDRPGSHELRITPPAPLIAGETVAVRVSYAGLPDDYSYAGESNWLANGREVVTMNQPHMAPWWFPANDHPRDKARFEVHVTVANGNRVIANGRSKGHTRGATKTTWHWSAAEPMAPYLAFFAAGKFDVASGTPAGGPPWFVGVSQQLSAGGRDGAMRLMKKTPKVISWLESELGKYPFNSTGGVVTSLNPGFALENQTRPTYPAVGAGAVDLLVHELAHQWFGDDVAVRNWRDIWLNEGFATYLEIRYAETHGGQSGASWLRETYDATGAGNQFWQLPIEDPGPDSIFDNAVYVRGAMTLQALRNRIGRAEFRQLLRAWAARHSGGSASSAQFRALAESTSGEDLAGFFDAWLVAQNKPADTADNGLG